MGNGSNAYHHRAGYAAFYLSGFNVTVTGSLPNKHKSLVSNNFPCNGGESCISGWFVSGQLQASYIQGPPSGGGAITGPTPSCLRAESIYFREEFKQSWVVALSQSPLQYFSPSSASSL